ncbi:MAG: STAS domain-containing protein [Gemmataceae bacterium]
MALLIFTRTLGPAFVFELHGAIDAASGPKLEPRVHEAIDAGFHVLIFDATKLNFISSIGISIFVAAFRRVQGHGAIRFAGLNEQLRHLFNMTGLTTRVELYPTVEDALVGPTAGS